MAALGNEREFLRVSFRRRKRAVYFQQGNCNYYSVYLACVAVASPYAENAKQRLRQGQQAADDIQTHYGSYIYSAKNLAYRLFCVCKGTQELLYNVALPVGVVFQRFCNRHRIYRVLPVFRGIVRFS